MLPITILDFDERIGWLSEAQIIIMVLRDMLTNIYRKSAYIDEMYLQIMQADAVVARKCFRVKHTALQCAFSHCVTITVVNIRIELHLISVCLYTIRCPWYITAPCYGHVKLEPFLCPFCTQSWRKTNFLSLRENHLLMKMPCVTGIEGEINNQNYYKAKR